MYDLTYAQNEWKIQGPLQGRSATLDTAIEYITKKREESSDPKIKKNATRTIAILKRLAKGPGKACAC